jgi:hypothetical protein
VVLETKDKQSEKSEDVPPVDMAKTDTRILLLQAALKNIKQKRRKHDARAVVDSIFALYGDDEKGLLTLINMKEFLNTIFHLISDRKKKLPTKHGERILKILIEHNFDASLITNLDALPFYNALVTKIEQPSSEEEENFVDADPIVSEDDGTAEPTRLRRNVKKRKRLFNKKWIAYKN